ncbi:MAG: flagellar basal-body rod protein FlgF [Fibromonadaceae bacterium]|jgi:flagellar basal-body rod protein FlgG|nr:flagellar basal-body rod protein FlgF [Fibromonadaceae bacterium]
MVNGLYSARNGMMLLQEMMDNSAHNLSNANTAGFKKSLMASIAQVDIRRNDELKLHQDEDQQMSENYIDYSQGSLVITDNPFDLALESSGFFEIETENGIRYTRNGSFTRNGMGDLVTLQGHKVLGTDGLPISLEEAENFHVSASGKVYADGNEVGSLSIVDFENKREALGREGYNLFYSRTDERPEQAVNATVKQGFLESSNVSVIDSMVEMIRFQRNYEANQKSVQASDETLNKAVNDIGRVG